MSVVKYRASSSDPWEEIIGDKGADGQGVPPGGTAGQTLVKSSSADYDTGWGSFPAAVGTNGSDLGAVTTFTPTRDCWCLIHFYTGSGQSMVPICRLNQNGTIIQQALGLVNAQTTSFLGAPVRGGMEYTIDAYRCSVTHVQLFY